MMQQPIIESPYLTFNEAMAYLRVSRSTLNRLLITGRLTGHKVNATWRFLRTDLDACLVKTDIAKPETPRPSIQYIELPNIIHPERTE